MNKRIGSVAAWQWNVSKSRTPHSQTVTSKPKIWSASSIIECYKSAF